MSFRHTRQCVVLIPQPFFFLLKSISVCFQFMFVLLAGVLLPYQTLSKPLKSQELEQKDQNISGGRLEGSQVVNGTSGIPEKRDTFDCSGYLNDFCGTVTVFLPPGNGCEIGRYVCRGYHEAVCKKTFSWESSTACNRNIGQSGNPRCLPHFRRVIINTSQGTKCVLQKQYCSC